jgi:hypothetical protein
MTTISGVSLFKTETMTLAESLRTNRGRRLRGAGQEAATELKQFFEILATRKPEGQAVLSKRVLRRWQDGNREYPHDTSNGDQMDFVEAVEIENGLIRKHRVYWGWFGVNVIKKDEYRR